MIHGESIRLRAIERSDIPTFVRWLNDPEITKGLLTAGPISLAEEERWFEGYLESQDRIFAIEIQGPDGWRHVGNVGLHAIDGRDRSATIGIMIGERDCWGSGYGKDAVCAAAGHGFDDLNLNRLELEVFTFNDRAMGCYEGCGFSREGVRREAHFRAGRYHDTITMSLLASEHRARAHR